MSSRGKLGAAARSRVVIPSSVRKTIDDIKEITGQKIGEDEIYAMLKDCSMDPNETAQKLLLLDAFHEVKKRRDRRRENLNKEPAQSRRKQGSQAQVNLAGRGNYSPKPLSHDAGGRRNSSAVKENVISHVSSKVIGNATLGNTQNIKQNGASSVASPITDIYNGPSGITSQSTIANRDNKCEVGSDHNLVEENVERNVVTILSQKRPDDVPGVGNNHDLQTMQTFSSRASPDFSIPQKAASNEVSAISVGSQPESPQTPENAIPELHRKFEELHVSNNQKVIIPNHIQVPEAGKLGFRFGSFDASFELEMTQDSSLRSDTSTPPSESSESISETVKVLQLSNGSESVAGVNTERQYPNHTQSHSQGPEDLSSGGVEVVSCVTHDHGGSEPKHTPQGSQHPIIHTSSSYNYGYVPPVLNCHLTPTENSESQACGTPHIPGFVMQQPFDLTSYYTQFYRSGMDSDGRISPLNSPGAENKYSNGNTGLISAQTSQSPLEANAPLFVSTASPVQAAGVMQSSISANQQHLPVFRQPTGIHLPYYPPFFPYAPYFSQFYVPPHAIHQFFSSGAFPQRPHGGSFYPNTNGETAKYSNSQNKLGSNTPSSTHDGIPNSNGSCNVALANYSSSLATEDLSSTQKEGVKESGMYTSNEQTEGSGVYLGQVAFSPTQPGPYTGVFHPTHAVHPLLQQSQPIAIPIDMMGLTGGVYPQQQQLTQLNRPSNY